jgi:hypothetical protein
VGSLFFFSLGKAFNILGQKCHRQQTHHLWVDCDSKVKSDAFASPKNDACHNIFESIGVLVYIDFQGHNAARMVIYIYTKLTIVIAKRKR